MFDIKTWVVRSKCGIAIKQLHSISRTVNFASLGHSWSLLLNFFFTRAALLEADVGKGNFCECGHRFHSLHGCAACVVWMCYWCGYRWCGCPHWFNWLQRSHWCSHRLTIRSQQKHRVAIQMKTTSTSQWLFFTTCGEAVLYINWFDRPLAWLVDCCRAIQVVAGLFK